MPRGPNFTLRMLPRLDGRATLDFLANFATL
ncbi:MAG: hypothetical protein H6Q03_188 [Acidobacteria bacterium]|nr:hypothetical protein [Acidobacteriota bacterium]